MIETASDLQGVLVVAREEGAQLGTVSGVHVDPDKKAISAVVFRARGFGGKSYFVPTSEIQLVGRDVVLISTEKAAKPAGDGNEIPGKSLKDLQGCWVTTFEGTHVGTLVDIDFSPRDWSFSEITLAEDKHLPIVPGEIKMGDEILVPPAYLDKVLDSSKEKAGVLGRVLGKETVEDMKNTIKRVMKRSGQTSDLDAKSDSDSSSDES